MTKALDLAAQENVRYEALRRRLKKGQDIQTVLADLKKKRDNDGQVPVG